MFGGQLVEVRGAGHAFEMRNGVAVEYATDPQSQTRRLRSLGCPEQMIPKVLAKRNQQRHAPRQTVREIDAQIRNLQTKLAAKVKAAPPVLSFAERFAKVSDAVRIDRVNMSTAQQAEDRKDAELRKKMQVSAGTYKGD